MTDFILMLLESINGDLTSLSASNALTGTMDSFSGSRPSPSQLASSHRYSRFWALSWVKMAILPLRNRTRPERKAM